METSLSNGAASSQEKENKIEGLERVKCGSLYSYLYWHYLDYLTIFVSLILQQIIQPDELIVMFHGSRVAKVV